MTAKINYIKGDATRPKGPGLKIITHCCNDIGAWGAGFVMALSKTYPEIEDGYLEWAKSSGDLYKTWHEDYMGTEFRLGGVLWTATGYPDPEPDATTTIYHIVGQRGVGRDRDGDPPIRYDALNEGFQKLRQLCEHMRRMNDGLEVTVHMPRMGCGLAGGNWMRVETLIKNNLSNHGISVTVYDL